MKRFLLLSLSVLAFSAEYAHAQQRRTALIVGNSAYAATSPLKNPANDARDMAAALSRLGFDVVNRQKMVDLTQKEMLAAIRTFGQRIRGGGVGLFFYAGHGMQVGGVNYLIPVDAKINNEGDVKYQSIDVDDILIEMENANNGVNILILDACRNNPFARGFRSTSNGLAQMNAPSGTLIAYATAPGSVASDGDGGRNGLYTKELVEKIKTPGLPIEEVFKRVRVSVRDKTQRAQIPWESTSLDAPFYFMSGTLAQTAAAAAPPSLAPRPVADSSPATPIPVDDGAGGRDPMEAIRKWSTGSRGESAGGAHVGTYGNMNDSNSNLKLSSDGAFSLRQSYGRGQYNNLVGKYLIEGEKVVLFVDVAKSARASRGERMECEIVDGGNRLRCHDGAIYMKK